MYYLFMIIILEIELYKTPDLKEQPNVYGMYDDNNVVNSTVLRYLFNSENSETLRVVVLLDKK